MTTERLSDFIIPDGAVARSINLERDLSDNATLKRYILTDKGRSIIHRLAEGLNGERVSAWSLTGPYGMGKSAFVRYLLALCGPNADSRTRQAQKMLARRDRDLLDRFLQSLLKRQSKTSGLFRVPVTAAFEPINRTLAEGLRRAVRDTDGPKGADGDRRRLLDAIDAVLKRDHRDAGGIARLFAEAGAVYRAPVAVALDEFGKNLEYLARFPEEGDLFILQRLAESDGVYLWVCLHQAFEAYASGLTETLRQEWGKVQGRFEDIAFLEPRGQMVQFIADTLRPDPAAGRLTRRIEGWAEAHRAEAARLGLREIADLDPSTFMGLYPLHPIAAAALPDLCIRFAQNDRTLFAFLCGGEPNALPAFLNRQAVAADGGDLPTFGPARLYDYFIASAGGAAMGRPVSSRWIEIQNMIDRAAGLPGADQDLLKTIGLLNLVAGPQGIRASTGVVAYAMDGPGAAAGETADALARLSGKGLLLNREYADEYRLWEGTDVDIRAEIAKEREQLGRQPIQDLLEAAFPLGPVIAARHSYETGTLRRFERRWTGPEALAGEQPPTIPDSADGLILYGFVKSGDVQALPPTHAEDGRPVLTAAADREEQVRDLALEAAASRNILTASPELARDGVARKEARFRARTAESRLRQYLEDLFTPGSRDVVWRCGQTVYPLQSNRNLSELLSHLCDAAFPRAPVLRNELINRNGLTAAAARARRELIGAMIDGEGEEHLGMPGTGPEVGIYRTGLLAEGLY
jgi:hypothetical protein